MIACTVPIAAFAVGCGGGDRQDKNEPGGSFSMEVDQADFPAKQTLAEPTELRIRVKNTDSKPLPNVAVTVDSFTKAVGEPGLADQQRPVWIVDEGPVGGDTAYVNTWALGRLAPGASKTFTWKVTAMQAGTRRVRYRVSPGLDGKAKPSGDRLSGSFTVNIAERPAQASVDPATGRVIRGQ